MDYNPLISTITNQGGQWFAALDGAQLEETHQRLSRSGLNYRCLYIGIDDSPSLLDTAPYLIDLNHDGVSGKVDGILIERTLMFAGKLSALTFWRCDNGYEVLYKHLRGINRVDIPIYNDAGEMTDKYERVVFRHSDANVLAQVLPALNFSELCRFVGPANMVLFKADDIWNKKFVNVERSENWPEPSKGVLAISAGSYANILDKREHGLIGKIEDYLNKVLPNHNIPDEKLRKVATESYQEAKVNGIKTIAGHYRWAYFYLKSDGIFSGHPAIQDYITDEMYGSSIDERIKNLMEDVIDVAENEVGEV